MKYFFRFPINTGKSSTEKSDKPFVPADRWPVCQKMSPEQPLYEKPTSGYCIDKN